MEKREIKNTFWRTHFAPTEAGHNLSWGSVIAGVVTTISIMLLLSLITSAIGFGVASPTEANPMDGVGIGMVICSVISLIISLFCGGFVAGLAARRTGLLHGFLNWSVTTLLMLTLLTSLISSAFGVAGNILGSVANTAGNVAGGAGNVISDASSAAFNAASEQIGDVDTQELQNNTEQILRDTEIEELQPEYIQGMLDQSREEIVQAGQDVLVNPENRDQILNDLTNSLQGRIDTLNNAADREAISQAVANNTDMTEAEAEEATDNIIAGLEDAQRQASEQIDNARIALNEASQEVDQTIEEVKVVAEDVTNKTSMGSIGLFFGLLVGLAVSSFGGIVGSRKVNDPRVAVK